MPKNTNSIYQKRINILKNNTLPKKTKKQKTKKRKQKVSKKIKRIRNNLNTYNKQNRIEELKKTLIDVRNF